MKKPLASTKISHNHTSTSHQTINYVPSIGQSSRNSATCKDSCLFWMQNSDKLFFPVKSMKFNTSI